MGREGRDYWVEQLSEYWESGLTIQGMRPASPMVRRKRDFFEWEFTKKMNAVGRLSSSDGIHFVAIFPFEKIFLDPPSPWSWLGAYIYKLGYLRRK